MNNNKLVTGKLYKARCEYVLFERSTPCEFSLDPVVEPGEFVVLLEYKDLCTRHCYRVLAGHGVTGWYISHEPDFLDCHTLIDKEPK